MEGLLTEKDWGKLQNVLHGRDSKWQAIGIQLHVAHDELTKIKQEHGHNLEECNREMQIAWLKSGKATWRALVAALSSGPVGLLEDAKRVEEKYLQCVPQDQHNPANQNVSTHSCSCPTVSTVTPETILNQYVQKNLLNEQLEWLIKMGFTVDDIMEWALTKQKLSDGEPFDNNSTLRSSLAPTEPPTLQEMPSTPQCVAPSDLDQSTPLNKDKTRSSSCSPNETPSSTKKRILTKTHSRKRSNTSQGKQPPKAKRGRSSRASLASSPSKGGELSLRSPLRSSVERSRQRSMTVLKENMMQVLEEIEQHPAAKEFIEQVDRERAANYYDVILLPMCLADMATKVLEDIYETPKMFCDDFDLIVHNCELYNGAESEYTQQARLLEAEFYQLVSIYFDDSEVEQRHSMLTTTDSPRAPEPTSNPNTTREEIQESPGKGCAHGSSSASLMDDEEVLCDGEGGHGIELGPEMRQQTRTHTGTTASSGADTSGDSDDDLPSFMDIFTNQNKN